ncbi:hypothetical protein L207DRAFT_580998 [Hyaloscypha variabilis F]|uniref:Uncharacterized protein n=1 Tax=Hyaloscypha variabilis (strain UAMH 11265 / GT02V1 / F) TaxID=1149755 RepID=A0A2J6RV01_HYAVF|nr:hypothetical protein L207DRAFT_580998 [Hyaloscypha variabilis F]
MGDLETPLRKRLKEGCTVTLVGKDLGMWMEQIKNPIEYWKRFGGSRKYVVWVAVATRSGEPVVITTSASKPSQDRDHGLFLSTFEQLQAEMVYARDLRSNNLWMDLTQGRTSPETSQLKLLATYWNPLSSSTSTGHGHALCAVVDIKPSNALDLSTNHKVHSELFNIRYVNYVPREITTRYINVHSNPMQLYDIGCCSVPSDLLQGQENLQYDDILIRINNFLNWIHNDTSRVVFNLVIDREAKKAGSI